MTAEVPVDPEAPTPDGVVVPRGPSARAVGGWLVLLGAAVALDGVVGGLAAVVIAALVLARLPLRVLGALGVAALVATPIAVLAQGLPATDEVSPSFVTRSLLPHHLVFAGLVWVGTWAVLDLLPHLVAPSEVPDADDGPPTSRARRLAGTALTAAVAVAALAACVAVLQA